MLLIAPLLHKNAPGASLLTLESWGLESPASGIVPHHTIPPHQYTLQKICRYNPNEVIVAVVGISQSLNSSMCTQFDHLTSLANNWITATKIGLTHTT